MTPPSGSILLFHAYDARNQGDGLLVSESLGLLERAGMQPGGAIMVAFNSASFPSAITAFQYPGAPGTGSTQIVDYLKLAGMAASGVTGRRVVIQTSLGRLARSARLLVGVGGGYLRAPGGWSSIPAVSVHLPQLTLAARGHARSIYLPQSVGPLRGAVGAALTRDLRRLDFLAVRDDRSAADLGLPSTTRFPDLAVLAVARHWTSVPQPQRSHRIVGIARHLERGLRYEKSLIRLARRLPVTWAVQSRAKRQNDDTWYRRVGLPVGGDTHSMLGQAPIGAVISVRLHGALQAILAGVPAIHLSYERKGYGAYDDLGIRQWLHPARCFDPDVVSAQAAALACDPSAYWSAIEHQIPRLLRAEAALVERVGRALH